MTTQPPFQPLSDSRAELLAAARAGSAEALGALLQACRAQLLLVAARELRTDLRVKVSPSDLVQETFAVAQQGLAGFEGTTTREFAAWLRGILDNKLAQARRRYLATARRDLRREEPPHEDSALENLVDLAWDGETASQLVIRDEHRSGVQLALAKLPEHYRQVIQLRNIDLLPFEDVALIMQRPANQIRALWTRAITRLTKELQRHASQ